MNMEPQNEPSIIAETVAFVLDTIMMVMQEAFQFAVESTKHAAQVHGVFTTEMQDHFYQMGCMVCVCVCAGVLGRRIARGSSESHGTLYIMPCSSSCESCTGQCGIGAGPLRPSSCCSCGACTA